MMSSGSPAIRRAVSITARESTRSQKTDQPAPQLPMINHYLDGRAKYDKVILAFYEGCPGPKKLIEQFKYEPADVAVVFGVNKIQISDSWPRGQVIARQRKENRNALV